MVAPHFRRTPKRRDIPHGSLVRLFDLHHGRTAIVIGGGPSAPDDLAIAQARFPDPIYLSANQHGYVIGVPVSYAVHVDRIHGVAAKNMIEFLHTFGNAPTIGYEKTDDIRLPLNWPAQMDSGLTACLVAQLLGCAPVIPCGFGRWQETGRQYFHDIATGTPRTDPLRGRDPYKISTMGSLSVVRVVSGPLLALFPSIDVPAKPNLGPLSRI